MFTLNSCCLFKITVPIGSKCLFIESISDFNLEQEVLLPRNSIISVVSFSNGTINAELQHQELPQDIQPQPQQIPHKSKSLRKRLTKK